MRPYPYLFLLLIVLSTRPTLGAPLTQPPNSALRCAVEGSSVHLSWQIVFVAPINGWVLERDGQLLVELPSSASEFTDRDALSGEHYYRLSAINFDGTVIEIGECLAAVGDFGMHCAVDGLQVDLEWGPILIDVHIERFDVYRDGFLIASLPAQVTTFADKLPSKGVFRYSVRAVTGPDHDFLLGACTVRSQVTEFLCHVAPPAVELDWSGVPLPEFVIAFFVVVRDDTILGATNALHFEDLPGPGTHAYQVYAVAGGFARDDIALSDLLAAYLVGECKIVMPGGGVPSPEELTCVDLDSPNATDLVADRNVDVGFLNASDVLLVWQKPVLYDLVVIARNYEFVAFLPGEQFYFVDRGVPPGAYTYRVFGIVNGNISAPATCEVLLPREPVPPPRDLVCEFVGAVDVASLDASPAGFVQLRWQNGGPYSHVVVHSGGRELVRLPGSSTRYRDHAPAPGLNTYSVFGVRGLRRSVADRCQVKVPVGRPPRPEELQCTVVYPLPAPFPEPVPLPLPIDVNVDAIEDPRVGDVPPDVLPTPSIVLTWFNPIRYDHVVVSRNGIQIAFLPGESQSFIDDPDFFAVHLVYDVVGVVLDRASLAARCEVDFEPPFTPPPQNLFCEVLGRAFGPDDPGVVVPAEVADDFAADLTIDELTRLPIVRLTWSNPVPYLSVFVSRNQQDPVELPGTATLYHDFRPSRGEINTYHLWAVGRDGVASARVRCEVFVPPLIVPPVRDLHCGLVATNVAGRGVVLEWVNAASYDRIIVHRDNNFREALPGHATSFFDPNPPAGVRRYRVVAQIGDRESPAAECRVIVPGPPPEDILFFSSRLILDTAADEAILPPERNGRVTCLASHRDGLQGWSFGVCSDPSVLVVADATIAGTTTAQLRGGAGPSFLNINRFAEGVSMAVIVDESDPTATLPPAAADSLLHIQFEPGPDAVPFGHYPVGYCDSLGSPPVAVLYVVGGFERRPDTLRGTVVLPGPLPPFLLRGDVNGDEDVSMSDAVALLNWLFLGGKQPGCDEQADINGSGEISLADAVYELQWEFAGGAPPPAPFPDCGPDSANLGCEEPSCPQPVF